MYVRFVLRIAGLCLLIAATVNAEQIKETALRSIWPTDAINVGCAAVNQPFSDVFCVDGFIISVINAHYGYHAVNRNIGESCSIQQDDCFVSVPLNSSSYYAEILDKCNGRTQCKDNLRADNLNREMACGPSIKNNNDYVSIQFYCLPPNVDITTISLCSNTATHGTINCNRNRVIHIVGAILGFQPYDNSSCKPEENSCHIQPDVDHLECILSSCQGMQECQFYAATSINRTDHTCDSLNYMFETVTYYCTRDSVVGALVTRSSECRPTPATPSTVPVTSVAYDSLPESSTPGGATIESDTSTYTIVDNLWNVSTVETEMPSEDNTTSIIVGSVVGSVVLIIVLLVLIFIIWRKRKSEDTSTRRGKDSDHGLNGFSPSGDTTLVNTPQDMTYCSIKYDVAPLSDKTSMPTHSLGNHPSTVIYALAQDSPHTRVNSLAQEPSTAASSLAREPSADYYSEVDDAVFRSQAQEPYIALYSLPQEPNAKFYKDIKKSAIYVNVTAPSKAVHFQGHKTNSSAYPKAEDPVRSAYSRVEKSEFAKVNIDPEEQQASYPTRSQSGDRSQDLVLKDNSLYVATEAPWQTNADELTLKDNSLYEWNSNLQSLSNA